MTPRPVHVIAEAGTTHEGSLARAREAVGAAATCGADSVKFQIIDPGGLYLPQIIVDGERRPNPVFAQREAQRLPEAAWPELAALARERGIGFSASIFDPGGLDLLDALDPPYIKIASCDLNHSALLRRVAERGRPMILSTGMAELPEIERAIHDVHAAGSCDVVLMHCVSAYPAALADMNLSFLSVLRETFGLPIGLSDHTESSLAAAIAIGLGATWIEKHFTYDRAAEGFDHRYAMEHDQLAAFIADVRAAEAACRLLVATSVASGAGKVRGQEAEVKPFARRGVYAARRLDRGAVIGPADLLVRRPESALAPNEAELVVGRTLERNVEPYEPIEWDALS